MTTFLLKAYCRDCMTELVPVTSAAMPCDEPEAEANCPTCNATYCVSARVERCYSIAREPFDPERAQDAGAFSAAYGTTTFGT